MESRNTSREIKRVGFFHIKLVSKRSESDLNIDNDGGGKIFEERENINEKCLEGVLLLYYLWTTIVQYNAKSTE